MFLAALILASKYIQDRNYSGRAWSKISGLKLEELYSNEQVFLQAVEWKLHIPEELFCRWQDTLLKYTTPHPPSTESPESAAPRWKAVIPLLTSELNTVDLPLQ